MSRFGKNATFKSRCKNCEHFLPLDNSAGVCERYGVTVFVRPNAIFKSCYELAKKCVNQGEKPTEKCGESKNGCIE